MSAESEADMSGAADMNEAQLVLVLDPRWPGMIPIRAISQLTTELRFDASVPEEARQAIEAIAFQAADLREGITCVTCAGIDTAPICPEDFAAPGSEAAGSARAGSVAAGSEAAGAVTPAIVIMADSLKDPVLAATATMARSRRQGEWEQRQTHASLIPYFEEETAEFAEAVESGLPDGEILKELGDVLLQVLFHAEIARERGAFTFDDVAASFVAKMRSRAPYLFDGSGRMVGEEEQQALWRAGKAEEERR